MPWNQILNRRIKQHIVGDKAEKEKRGESENHFNYPKQYDFKEKEVTMNARLNKCRTKWGGLKTWSNWSSRRRQFCGKLGPLLSRINQSLQQWSSTLVVPYMYQLRSFKTVPRPLFPQPAISELVWSSQGICIFSKLPAILVNPSENQRSTPVT